MKLEVEPPNGISVRRFNMPPVFYYTISSVVLKERFFNLTARGTKSAKAGMEINF